MGPGTADCLLEAPFKKIQGIRNQRSVEMALDLEKFSGKKSSKHQQ
ncbi:hypothetical protein F441_07194 [Phytophthora nicotianae CJ01A1]|uniref:Uncharacterized protein n=1 Tax=Phytophthora nicotianae CJ01A1 TaxID=1317063 RepID=W2X772_PHYNI|nr:hypothetical protein F441_07194 [Phytophthora nicotianae CJ01A1]